MRFISSDVKINFIIAYAVGSIFILWNPLGTWNLIFPVIAMLGYLLIGSKGQLFVADEQKGDSFYYLGFLAPYLDLCCLLAVTPWVSRFPLNM